MPPVGEKCRSALHITVRHLCWLSRINDLRSRRENCSVAVLPVLRQSQHKKMAAMHRTHRLRALFMLALALAAESVWAAPVTYEYTGNAFNEFYTSGPMTPYDSTHHVTATISLTSALGASFDGEATATAFSLSNGRFTIDESDATSSLFRFRTDATGSIAQWSILGQIYEPVAGGGGMIQGISTERWDYGRRGFRIYDYSYDAPCGVQLTPGVCALQPLDGGGYIERDGQVLDDAGLWTVAGAPNSVPEPSTLELAGLALTLLAWSARGRKQPRRRWRR
jgi:hypothetical protein